MTLDEKLGQMLLVGFRGTSVAGAPIERLIREHHVGNVVLFERNVRGMRDPAPGPDGVRDLPRRVATLVGALQAAVRPLRRLPSMRIPLLVAVDQENGSAAVLERGVTALPGSLALGQTRDAGLAWQAGRVTGAELAALGITMNLAPVLDLATADPGDVIGDRAFGSHPEMVATLGVAFAEGLAAAGVVPVAKHVPGHAGAMVDPHDGLPTSRRSADELAAADLVPFRRAIEAGVPALMTAHVHLPGLGMRPGVPFSLDAGAIARVVREDLGFAGVIVTDDLLMRAVREVAGPGEAVARAIRAGSDLVLLADVEDAVRLGSRRLRRILARLRAEHRHDARRIDEAVRRVLLLKLRTGRGLDPRRWTPATDAGALEASVATRAHRQVAARIAEAAIVAVSGPQHPGGLPAILGPPERGGLLVVSPVFRVDDLTPRLAARLAVPVRAIPLRYGPAARQDVAGAAETIAGEAARSAAVLFGVVTRDHGAVLERVAARVTDRPIVAVALRSPAHVPETLLDAPRVTVLATGSGVEPSLDALVRVLLGEIRPRPVAYLSVGIGRRIDPDRDPGAPLIPRTPP